MPELAKPLSLFGAILNEQRNSKSATVPLVQIRNVFPFAGCCSVVWPVITPSFTDQSCASPFQPARSLPLKIGVKPFSESAAGTTVACVSNAAHARIGTDMMDFITSEE